MDYPESTERFLAAARQRGLDPVPTVFPEGTKTAASAAEAIGCDVAAIVKSLVFMVEDRPVLVLMPGDKRVDMSKLAAAFEGAEARRASLEEVREHTGYSAGGTPPIGHRVPLPVVADPLLRRHDEVWAAAGTPTTVFPVATDLLVEIADASWADVAER